MAESSPPQESDIVRESFDGPRDTFQFFLQMMVEYKAGNRSALNEAIKTFNLSRIDPSSRRVIAQRAAEDLINVLDRLEKIDINLIPQEWDQPVWYYRQHNILVDQERQYVEIAIAKTESDEDDEREVWLFTPETVSTIGAYYRFIRHRPVVEGVDELRTWRSQFKKLMPQWTAQKTFVFLNGQWLGIFIILLFAMLFDRGLKYYFDLLIKKLAQNHNLFFNQEKQKKLSIPITLIIVSVFWNAGIFILEFPETVFNVFFRIGRVTATLGFVLIVYHIVDIISFYLLEAAKKSENKFDDILVPLVRKSAKTVIVAIGFVAIGDSLSLDMKSMLAGLGIGGIAFALAARDTISNMFGCLTVLLDRPFQIGDWINIGDGDVEGIVEEVGLRSTRVRTFYNSQITVPNGQLTNVNIDNYGRREYRRYTTTFGLQYDTPPEKIEAFCESIRQLILASPHTRKDMFHVYFSGFNDASLDVLMWVFFKVPDFSMELTQRHALLLDILRVAKELDIRFAFPTQTLHLFNEEHKEYRPFEDDSKDYLKVGEEAASKIASHPIAAQTDRSSQNAIKQSQRGL